MAVRCVFKGDVEFGQAARTSLTINRPSKARVNDVLLLVFKLHSTAVTPEATNWRLDARQTNTVAAKNHQLVILHHRILAEDPESWRLEWGGTSLTTEGYLSTVRGAPTEVEPIDAIRTIASAENVTTVPFITANSTRRGLVMYARCSWSVTGFNSSQPEQWWYGRASTERRVACYEYPLPRAQEVPTPAPRANSSDAYTSATIIIKDAEEATFPSFNCPHGLDGVKAPANGGWASGYEAAVTLGVSHVRTEFGPGMSQEAADAEFSGAAERGLSVLPIILEYRRISTMNKPAFAEYVASFVRRYGPGGSFWYGRRDRYLAPVYFEIQNEPYQIGFFGTVEPEQYAELFVLCVRAGREANPAAKYLIAGVDRFFQSGTWHPWIPPMYTAQPTLSRYVDGITVHLYGDHPLNLSYWENYGEWPQVETVAEEFYNNGVDVGGAAKIWATEFGFTTTTRTEAPNYGITEAQQTTQLLLGLSQLHTRWTEVIGGAFIYRYRDGREDTREERWGLVHFEGANKPSYEEVRRTLPTYTRGRLEVVVERTIRPRGGRKRTVSAHKRRT